MSHTRKVCPHDMTISQCRCIHYYGDRATEVVRPCPFGDEHLGMAVVHPEQPTAGGQEPVEAALTIQIHGRKSGKVRPAWDLINAIQAEHGVTLAAFSSDLALYGMVAMDEHGRRIDPGAWVIRP